MEIRILFLLMLFGLGSLVLRAEDASQNLDDALLEDLGAQLLQPITKKQKPKPSNPPSLLDKELAEQLGQDISPSQTQKENWLSRVIDHMQKAEMFLQQRDKSTSASSAQTEALTGLDAMIVELQKRKSQCSGGNCNKLGSPKPSKKSDKKSNSNKKAGKKAAKSSAPPTQKNADLSTELAVAGDLVKDLWGKLPERQREKILQPLSEEFLPKYASEIEDYFRTLADPERTNQGAP